MFDSQMQACSMARIAFEKKSYEQAAAYFNEALELSSSKEAYLGLGQVYNAQGDIIKAVKNLTEAIKIDRFYHEAFSLLGDIYFDCGNGTASIESYGQAVAINPSNNIYKQKLIRVVGAMSFKKVNSNLKGVLLECLESDEIELTHFGRAWLSIFSADPLIARIYKLSKHKNYDAFKKGMDNIPNCDGLIEPFFLTGLGKFIVPEPNFERWCTYLRRFLLEAVSLGKQLFSDPEDIDLITCALSKFCFFTDYILNISESELLLLNNLQEEIKDNNKPKLHKLAMLACYDKICLFDNAKEIASNLHGGNHVSQILKSQIEDYLEQQEIKKHIPKLTKIENETSLAVQEQYEEFPYPRWEVASRDLFNDIEAQIKDKKANILIAGCGTGKEAVQLAFAFPDAQITAIDLSRNSLAYAIFKARQFGIDNIKFMHGDIVSLDSLAKESFDYVSSVGVLHHMKDPIAGWKIINNLLKPDGLMRIALYSSKARWAINNARKVIKDKDIGSDAKSIRIFRSNINEYLKYKSIKNIGNSYDYYSLPECRDLLFHVQEHQYDLPEIKGILDELKLEFLQFYLSDEEIKKYKKHNPNDSDATDLDSWANWESKNPNLFVAMYAFWCKKKTT